MLIRKYRKSMDAHNEDEKWIQGLGNYKNEKSRESQEQDRLKKELDALLDKISRDGLHTLSDEERFRLNNLSQQLNTEDD